MLIKYKAAGTGFVGLKFMEEVP